MFTLSAYCVDNVVSGKKVFQFLGQVFGEMSTHEKPAEPFNHIFVLSGLAHTKYCLTNDIFSYAGEKLSYPFMKPGECLSIGLTLS